MSNCSFQFLIYEIDLLPLYYKSVTLWFEAVSDDSIFDSNTGEILFSQRPS